MSIVLLLLALTRTLHGSPVPPHLPCRLCSGPSRHTGPLRRARRERHRHQLLRHDLRVHLVRGAPEHPCTDGLLVDVLQAAGCDDDLRAAGAGGGNCVGAAAASGTVRCTAHTDVDAHSDRRTYTRSVLDTVRKLFHDSPLPPALKKGEVPRWTLTHGFLLQMGGFMLCEDGRPIQILTIWNTSDEVNLIWNIQHGIVDAPRIPEQDIQDRSKGDAISKTLIVLQTTWFIVQCLARWSARLPVTELEVVTLGFALLNGVTYGLWWYKPQNVGRAVYLSKKPQIQSRKPRFPRKRPRAGTPKPAVEGPTPIPEAGQKPKKDPPNLYSTEYSAYRKKTWLRQTLQTDIAQHSSSAPWNLLWLLPLDLATALLRPLGKLAEYGGHDTQHYDTLRVPMFASGFARDSAVFLPTAAIGALFGLVHLVCSWFLRFATPGEAWVWRACAVAITGGPVLLGCWRYFYFSGWEKVLRTGMFVGVPVYVVSRVVILVLSIVSLRELSGAALQTVDWTTFIPHL